MAGEHAMNGPADVTIHVLLFLSLYFEIFMLLTFLEKPRHAKADGGTRRHTPSTTIIVPCYNESRTLVKTVDSLLSLNYPPSRLNVMLVDDGSTDATWEVMQQYRDNSRVSIHRKANGGKHTALNYGITNSTSELVGCLDADSNVDPEALNEVVHAFETHKELSAVIPAIRVGNVTNILQLIQRAEYTLSVFMRRSLSLLNANFITPGPFTIFKRQVFDTIGLYREAHNTEDCEIALRMQSHGLLIGNTPAAHVYTTIPRTYRTLFRQRVRWTYGFIRNFADYKHILFSRQFGTLGAFILPVSFLSIFSAIFFTGMFIVSAASEASEHFTRIQTVGMSVPSFHFDWFFLNTSSVMFITFSIIVLTFLLIAGGKRLLGESNYFSADVPLFLLLYGFIAPWWLLKSVYNAALARKESWTAERAQ